MDEERGGDEVGQEEARDQGLPVMHRIAAWLVRHFPALQEREQAAYNAGAMTASLYAAQREHRSSHPGVVIEVAHQYSPFQLRSVVWEMEEMDRLTKAVLLEKMVQFLGQFIEWRKVEGVECEIQYRARLIVYRTENGGKTIIEESGKDPRSPMRLPGDEPDDTPGPSGEYQQGGDGGGPGVVPETPGDREEGNPGEHRDILGRTFPG